MKKLREGINLQELTKEQVRAWRKERLAAFNSNDDEKIREFIRKYKLSTSDDEMIWQASKHKARVKLKGIFPKLKRESRVWLKEHGFTEESR